MKTLLALLVLSLLVAPRAHADEVPAFDRPGIGFSTRTLGRGVFAWEQGLPDASRDRSAGTTTTTWAAATLLRAGLSDTLELQLGADSWGQSRRHGSGGRVRESGGGDGSVALKWAPALSGERLSLALKAGATLPWGQAPLGGAGHDYDLGVTLAWAMPRDASLALYADRQWGEDGSGWLLSPSYGVALREDLGVYVEAGYGTDAQYMRAAGAGVTWMATPRLQLDVSLLRGLDARTTDWQGGVGLSLAFD